jgi:Toxin SymE, type I toxin-antitoxin system
MKERKERRYTMTNRKREHGAPTPELRMSGLWLGRAGFEAGSRLSIAVRRGRLVVTVAAPPGPRGRPRQLPLKY